MQSIASLQELLNEHAQPDRLITTLKERRINDALHVALIESMVFGFQHPDVGIRHAERFIRVDIPEWICRFSECSSRQERAFLEKRFFQRLAEVTLALKADYNRLESIQANGGLV